MADEETTPVAPDAAVEEEWQESDQPDSPEKT